MRGELDNVTVAGGSIVLDLVQGSYVPYGCYTSAPIPMPLFDAPVAQLERRHSAGHRRGDPGAGSGGRQLDGLDGLWQVEPLPEAGGAAPGSAARCS